MRGVQQDSQAGSSIYQESRRGWEGRADVPATTTVIISASSGEGRDAQNVYIPHPQCHSHPCGGVRRWGLWEGIGS